MNRFFAMLLLCTILPFAACAEDAHTLADKSLAAKGNNAFALDLYAQLKAKEGNLFFSPLSISTALAMVYGGAGSDTVVEMAKTLHFDLPQARLHPAMAQLLGGLNAQGEAHGYQLAVANALWFQKGFTFQNGFLAMISQNYKAGLNEIDFIGNAEAARVTINDWVGQRTAHKITNLIPPGILTSLTRMVLTNAVYFKGSWLTPFDKQETRDENFYPGTHLAPHLVPMMHRAGAFNYFDGGTFQALEMPYVKNDLSMIVFLPNDIDSIGTLEQNMTADNVAGWLGNLKNKPKVQLALPTFKMDSGFELADTLQVMGMKQSFSSSADFSGITGHRDVMISDVLHKAYADVNEEGTEAAAATAIVISAMSVVMLHPDPPILFRADHPFLFLIRDNASGSILFMGRMNDPK